MRKSHRSLFLKSIATVLVFTILFSQTAWAIDVRQMLADAYATFDEEDALRPHGMAASDLQAGQQAQQAAVNQQQAMQDLENLNFSLTTQNGDVLKYIDEKLDSIERPDGTTLKNIVTDAQGNIVEADLKLADGSIQVFQNGQVLGYQTPDGTQIIYENGRVKKTISKSGEETLYSYVLNGSAVTETTLDSPSRTTKYDANGKIKESTRKSDNQKTIYLNGIIQKIVNGDGTQIQFTSQIVSGDTVVTPQGGTATEYYTDAQGNKFYFVSGNVSKIILADGSTVDGITWDSANKIDGATLTQTDGSKFIYQAKQLTRSYDPAGVVTNYTYTATSITASKSGNTWEYLLDGTPTRSTTLAGDIATYLQTGTYKGFKATEIIGGVTYTYTYQGSGAAITAQRTGPGGSTVLPVTTLQTAFRSSRNATESWLQDNAEGSLYTWYNNLYVTYNINLPAAGDLKIEFDSTNFGANIPSNFSFQLEISVDNVVKTQYYTPQGPGWKTNSLTLTGLTLGAHTIKINWVNQYYATGYDSNFKFKNLKLSQSSASTAQTVTTGYQSTPLTPRVDTVKKSLITKPAATTVPSSADFTSITYDPNAKLKQVIFKDGSKLIFDQGILKQALDPAGKQTSFNFEQSALSTIIGSTITQSNLTSTYSATGKLSSIKTGDVTVHYKEDGSAVDWIEKTDGTEMWNLAFDSSGALRDAIIYTPDGEERTYQAGKLVGLRRPDQTQLIYASDKLVQMVTPEKLTYTFTYTASKIEAAIQSTVIPDALTPIKMEYDLQFNLKKVTRQNQEILNYLNTDLVQIDAPGNTAKIFAYQKDSAGKILSYTVTQGNVVTSYDAANNPVSAVISPTSDNPNTFNVTYTYGRIRSVKKNNVVVFNYTYSFDSDGNEVTVIDDLETNTVKTYSGGNMLYALDKNTQVQTNYTYSSNKVSRVNVSRFGRILNEYAYAYSGADTIVTDSQNVIRTYGSDQKLKFLERDGEKYQYTYSQTTAASGPAVSQTAVLPVSTLNTTSRETNSYGGKWVDNPTEQSLATDSPYLALTYTFDLSQAGDLKLDFDSTNWGANIPSNFSFQFDYAIDGVWKWNNRTLSSPGPGWKSNQTVFAGLSAGQHTITIKWTNDYWVANQYDANLKIKNLKLTHTFQAPAQTPKDITEESLVEKRLSDGTIIRYSAAKVDRIDYANGKIFKNLVRNEKGELTGATLFQSAADTLGTKYQFADGEISKVTLPTGQDLIYSYDRDVTGNITTTWVKKGAAKLQYDAQGNLKSLRIDGVLTPEEIQQSVTHTYVGGVGSLSIDGNYNTAQSVLAGCSGCGGSGATAVSEHALSFVQPQTLTDLQFRMAVSAWAHGNYTRNYNATYYVEVQKNGVWQTVPGTTYFASGGDGDVSQDSKTVILAGLNLDGVTALRAFANGFGNASGGEGNSGGSASIYEIQYKLADLANLSFSLNSSSQTERYALTGYRGSVKFDTQGKITQANSSYSGISQELANVVQNYTSVPNLSSELNTMYAAMADGDTVVLQEYSADGTLETQTRADGTVTLYANNKPAKMLSATGETLIEYSYDAAGNPTRVFLKNTRSELPELVAAARLEIEKKRSEALRGLVAQKNLAYQSILDQANQNRQSLESARGILEGQLKQISSISAKGKEAKSQKADAISQINGSLDQIIGQFTTLYSQEADAYAALDAQVKTVSDQIEVDSQKAVTDLGTQETNFKKEILRQEVSPIVYDVYRRILGRDPDTNEYNSWINQIDYNSGAGIAEVKTTAGINLTQALNTAVNALPELAQRQAYVNTIKSSVTSEVNAYLAMTQTQKEAYAASLGLTSADLIPLSSADGAKILAWINSRSLHFGQSAFLSLESLLDQKGISYAREDLAEKCIIIDVLTGIISPLDDGDLVISMYALNKVAGLYGLSLAGANVNWDDLVKIYQTNPTAKVIAHVNGNHYLVIQSINISAGTITYMDPGAGKDKQNQIETILKGDFLKKWKGNVTLEQTKLQAVTNYQAKTLSTEQTQKIRGAFFFLLLPAIFAAIANIGGAVWAVINGVGAIIAAAGSLIGGALSSITGALTSIANGIGYIGSALFQGIGYAASSIFGAIGNVGSFLSQTVFGSIAKASFGNAIFQTAVKVGLNFAINKGLESLGINSTISSLASAFVTGGISGGFNAGLNASSFIAGGIKGLALEGSQTLFQKVGLDANLSSVLSLASGQFVNGILQGNLGGQLVKIAQNLGTGLSFYGIQKFSESLGIDSRVSTLIGAPISGGLSAVFQGGMNVGANIISAVKDGITRGVTNLAIDFAGQKLNLSPLVQGLTANAITGALLGAFQYSGNFLKGAFDSFFRSAANILTLDGNAIDPNDPNYSYLQLRHLAEVLDFSKSVRDNGLVKTLESHASQIFQRDAIENIFKQGGIQAFITNKARSVLINGVTLTEIAASTNDIIYLDPATDNMKGRVSGNIEEWGRFGFDTDGSFKLIDGQTINHLSDGSTVLETLQNGNLVLLQYKQGNSVISEIRPNAGKATIVLNSDGSIKDGVIKFLGQAVEMTFKDGQGASLNIASSGPDGLNLSEDFIAHLDLMSEDQTILPQEQRLAAQDKFNQFLNQEIKPLLLQDLTADQVNDIFNEIQTSGNRIINDPQNYNAEAARLTAEATIPVGEIENFADLGTKIQQKALEWGLRLDLGGHPILGFAAYFLGDQAGDILKVGEGTAQAMDDFQNGKIGHGLLGILSDVGRASIIGGAAAKLGKASLMMGTAGFVDTSIASRGFNAIKRLFGIGESALESSSQAGLKASRSVAESFGNLNFKGRELLQDEIWYRTVGSSSEDISHWLGQIKPNSAAQAEQLYNIAKWGNDGQEVVAILVKKGTKVLEGPVSGGTGFQIFIENLDEAKRLGLKVLSRESLS